MALFQSPICSGMLVFRHPGRRHEARPRRLELGRRIVTSDNKPNHKQCASEAGPINQLGLQEYVASQRMRRQPLGRESSTCTQVVWIFFW